MNFRFDERAKDLEEKRRNIEKTFNRIRNIKKHGTLPFTEKFTKILEEINPLIVNILDLLKKENKFIIEVEKIKGVDVCQYILKLEDYVLHPLQELVEEVPFEDIQQLIFKIPEPNLLENNFDKIVKYFRSVQLTNQNFLNEISLNFLKWVKIPDLFLWEFELISTLLRRYMEQELEDIDFCSKVAENLQSTVIPLDDTNYSQKEQAYAYIINHFLITYHRYQIITRSLIEHKLLPILTETRMINLLSVASGPAPSLFALNDIYSILSFYIEKTGLSIITRKISVDSDLIELSENFKNFVRNFRFYHNNHFIKEIREFKENITERQNLKTPLQISISSLDKYNYKEYPHKFDIIIFSYFLVSEERIGTFEQQIIDFCHALNKNGIFIIVGSTGQIKKIKEKLSAIFKNFKNFVISKVHEEIDMSFEFKSAYGIQVTNFHKWFLDFLNEKGLLKKPSKDLNTWKENMSKKIEEVFRHPVWSLLVFKKESKQK